MKNFLGIIIVAAILVSCNEEKAEEGYVLDGTLKNVPDSTMVVLSKDNTALDSALVIGEKFRFTGKVEEPISVYLTTRGSRDYITLWLENSEIEFSAEQGNFKERVITGSKIQEEDDLLDQKIMPIRKSWDSLRSSLTDKNLSAAEKASLDRRFEELRRREMQATKDFVRENPASVVSAYMLNFYKTTWGKKESEELYALLPKERRESGDGQTTARYLALNRDPQPGEPYVNFKMPNASGEPVKLSEVRKKYTLLQFWASGCYYSRQENPRLVEIYEKYNDRGFEILGVSIDENRNEFLKTIKNDQLPWPNLMQPSGNDNDAALIYGINSTPDNFLIDQNGIIIARDIWGEELNQKLQKLLPPLITADL